MSKHKIVIVGGGFAGIKAALELAEDRRFRVTLISDKVHFNYYPAMYRTASGGRRIISSIPLSEIFRGKPVHLVHDTVVSLDRKARTVRTHVGHTVSYDGLLLGLGVQTNYFNIKGLAEYSYGMKNIADAEALKYHLHEQLLSKRAPDLHYVIVGGGPTGVEMAGILPSYLEKICKQHNIRHRSIHVDLVEAAPRILPRFPKSVSRRVTKRLRKIGVRVYTHASVQAQSADSLMVNNKPIRSHTVIWTAGVTNNPFFKENDFQLARNGKVRVDQFLQAEPGIYVIGDNADTPYSGMAQTALYDAKFVARNLKRLAEKQLPKPYVAKEPSSVIPVGPFWAAFSWRSIHMYGLVGTVLRHLADLIAYHDYEPWQIAARRWAHMWEDEDNCPLCSDPLNRQMYLSGEPSR